METGKVEKKNIPYMLGYIAGPLLLVAVSCWIGYIFFHDGGIGAVVTFLGMPILAVLWYCLAGRLIYKSGVRKLKAEMEGEDLYTFNGRGSTVIVDVERSQVGLVFFWNPMAVFIIPANRIDKVWVDDGRHGAGFMEGSSQVSFLFRVDGVTVRVYTFTSNKRWRMDSDYILTGISKADAMAEVLTTAIRGKEG